MSIFKNLSDDLMRWIEDSHQLIEQHGREHGWGVSSDLFQPVERDENGDIIGDNPYDDEDPYDDEEETGIELLDEDDEFFDPFGEDELDLGGLDAGLGDEFDDFDNLFEEDDEDF